MLRLVVAGRITEARFLLLPIARTLLLQLASFFVSSSQRTQRLWLLYHIRADSKGYLSTTHTSCDLIYSIASVIRTTTGLSIPSFSSFARIYSLSPSFARSPPTLIRGYISDIKYFFLQHQSQWYLWVVNYPCAVSTNRRSRFPLPRHQQRICRKSVGLPAPSFKSRCRRQPFGDILPENKLSSWTPRFAQLKLISALPATWPPAFIQSTNGPRYFKRSFNIPNSNRCQCI